MDRSNLIKNLKNFVFIVILILLIYVALNNFKFNFIGYERIFGFLEGEGDAGRSKHFEDAMKKYLQKIIFGHGAGSELFLFPVHSHNLFTEIAVEYGTIGLVVLVSVLGVFFNRLRKLIKKDEKNHLIFLMFICGFVMNMFSGYYFTITIAWFALGYVFSSQIENDAINIKIRIN